MWWEGRNGPASLSSPLLVLSKWFIFFLFKVSCPQLTCIIIVVCVIDFLTSHGAKMMAKNFWSHYTMYTCTCNHVHVHVLYMHSGRHYLIWKSLQYPVTIIHSVCEDLLHDIHVHVYVYVRVSCLPC